MRDRGEETKAICHQAESLFREARREANESATALFRQAIKVDPSYAPAFAGLAKALCAAMIRYGQPRSLVEESLAMAQRAISLDPSLPAGHEALASSAFARGDLRASLDATHKVYAINPAFPDAAARIAFLHLDLGELIEAVEWSSMALRSEPRSGYIHRNIGRLCLMFGETTLAGEWLRRAVEFAPTFSSARILLIYLLLSQAKVELAQEQVKAMLSLRPNDPETLNYAADVALMLGSLDQARRDYERGLELGSDSRNFYRARRAKTAIGYIHWMCGEREAAQRLFDERKAPRIQEFSEGLNAWGPPYELAAIHAVIGDTIAAIGWLQSAIERGWREPHLTETDVLLKPLFGKPEFQELMNRLRRRIGEMRKRVTIPPLPPRTDLKQARARV